MLPVSKPSAPINAAIVAGRLAAQLEARGHEYAVGGAIALGYWGVPRGTVDVDLTVYLSPERLADLAGVRQETLSRIETGRHTASQRTIEKIMR